MDRQSVVGILAHVDAGKTTLSEAMLYKSGTIRRLGRVDNGDAFLDTEELEKARGITIFSKQARLNLGELEITLLDTPGHVDFCAEMERTLQVLDYAVLVISGADGVQAHTETLWKLLERYEIPCFVFVNKMDQEGTDRKRLSKHLQQKLDGHLVDFTNYSTEGVSETELTWFYEEIATCDEQTLEEYLEKGRIGDERIQELIASRRLFPCFYGSALKIEGVEELLEGLKKLILAKRYGSEFGARVYKIARDDQKNRLTYLKVTGGSLRVRSIVTKQQEKVTQLRLYSGEKYVTAEEVPAGMVCAVLGLESTKVGQGLGVEEDTISPMLEPVITYRLEFPPDVNAVQMLPLLKEIEEEEPQLHIVWDEILQEIQAQLMGEVQIEILKNIMWERYKVEIAFGAGRIVYKETINNVVEGIGHFEPLRHYAEVHLLLEPAEPGSGIEVASQCSEDILDKNWQRLIMTHIEEKIHRGVLLGAPLTDIRISILTGRAHPKHTEGGDFRQATYRAIRQGLMRAENVLLEPYYSYRLEIPDTAIGKAMNDMERRHASCQVEEHENGKAVLVGKGPVVTLNGYQTEVVAYTKGLGRFTCSLTGYAPCHNTKEVLEQNPYDPEADSRNPTGSVFCAHGAGFVVPWNEVPDYMHLPYVYEASAQGDWTEDTQIQLYSRSAHAAEKWIGTEEIDAILNRTMYANRKEKFIPHKGIANKRIVASVPAREVEYQPKQDARQKYLLVDGYNVIFAWKELQELSLVNMDSAKDKLLDILCNYQGMTKEEVIVVFDAYRVEGHTTEYYDYHNIHVVYTKEAETADQYIERFAHEHHRKYKIRVATSDGLEQIIIRGQGCLLVSARELEKEVLEAQKSLRREYLEQTTTGDKNYLGNYMLTNLTE